MKLKIYERCLNENTYSINFEITERKVGMFKLAADVDGITYINRTQLEQDIPKFIKKYYDDHVLVVYLKAKDRYEKDYIIKTISDYIYSLEECEINIIE